MYPNIYFKIYVCILKVYLILYLYNQKNLPEDLPLQPEIYLNMYLYSGISITRKRPSIVLQHSSNCLCHMAPFCLDTD